MAVHVLILFTLVPHLLLRYAKRLLYQHGTKPAQPRLIRRQKQKMPTNQEPDVNIVDQLAVNLPV